MTLHLHCSLRANVQFVVQIDDVQVVTDRLFVHSSSRPGPARKKPWLIIHCLPSAANIATVARGDGGKGNITMALFMAIADGEKRVGRDGQTSGIRQAGLKDGEPFYEDSNEGEGTDSGEWRPLTSISTINLTADQSCTRLKFVSGAVVVSR